MSGHTPGPWTVSPTWTRARGTGCEVRAQEVSVAECWLDGDEQDAEAMEALHADARLIAASPLMLEALRVAKSVADRRRVFMTEEAEQIDAAINEASKP